jgi:uncharacterized protein YbcI
MTEIEPSTPVPVGAEPGTASSPSIVAEIARSIVHLHAQYYGRGPTKAKAIYRNDIVTVILEEIFTKAEQLLTDAGEFERVRSHRQAFQDQVEPLFRQVVEEATGRSVRAFLSQVSQEGVASEVFVLEADRDAGSAHPPQI